MTIASTSCCLLVSCALIVVSVAGHAKDGDAAVTPSAITVIELPPPLTGLPVGQQRTHHALSIATDAPKPFLRSLGLDATECSLRLRLPSRIKPARDAAAGVRLEVQAQAGLGCRF
jgi:hypothetical protein